MDSHRHGNKRVAMKTFILVVALATAVAAPAQAKYTPAEFTALVHRCAPNAAVSTMLAIARTESALQPYAISLNSPRHLAKKQGYTNSVLRLAREPKSLAEALAWTGWFHSHGLSVSIGLMQVNIEMAARYGVTDKELFDPCTNIAVAAAILGNAYKTSSAYYGQSDRALVAAISAYNTGNWKDGIANGYVAEVLKNGRQNVHDFRKR